MRAYENVVLTLATVPSDVIRKILALNQEQIESMRMVSLLIFEFLA